MNRKLTGLLGAVGLASVGTLVLVAYVSAAEERAVAGERLVPVLVVASPVEKGTPAGELGEHVRSEQVPAKVRPEGAVTDLGVLEGTVAAVDLVPGEQLLADRFAAPEQVGPVGLPPGLEEVTLNLESERAVGGRVRTGSQVAVFASFTGEEPRTAVILRDAPVVAVAPSDSRSAGDDGGTTPGAGLLVTLAVDPAVAERIVFGAEHGRIWLSGADGGVDQEGIAS
jgi:pilus assembly protein CpaB